LDLFSIYGVNPRIPNIKTNYITDGLHPNNAGHELLAKRIYPLLEALQKN
jgi:lysophospholipase L1-like esterase